MPLTITHRRLLLLAAATTVSLSSGTNYVFSAYAPQLALRLHLTSTQLNLIGIAGNLGVYTSGPIWGIFIDRNGPRGVLACAAGLVLAGYGGIRYLYLSGGTTEKKASTGTVWALALCMLMTGYAASAGLNSSLNTVARSFPSSSRATASGITLAGFGLSAFLFSTLAHVVFPGRIEAFLGLLAVGTAMGMIVGVVGVRPIHQIQEEGYVPVDEEETFGDSPEVRSLALTRSRSTEIIATPSSLAHEEDLETDKNLVETHVVPVEITGTQLFSNLDFWIMTAILTLRMSASPPHKLSPNNTLPSQSAAQASCTSITSAPSSSRSPTPLPPPTARF
jgi:MFS family permease